MPRNASGTYSLPPEYIAESGSTILANQHNSPLEDLQTDANNPRPVTAGGTGASSAVSARSNLGVMASSDIQAGYVPKVATMAALSALDTGIYKAAVLTQDTRQKLWMWMLGDYSTQQAADTSHVNYIAAAGVSTTLGCWVAATGAGVSVAAIVNGGTGAATAVGARTNLGLAIGADVQAHSAVLDATTASYTTAEKTKLGFLTLTGAVDLDADNTKLAGIEAGADVTDAANVVAAGATMRAADRTALKALAGATYSAIYLCEARREGVFQWDASDLSAKVALDTQEAVYVAPTSDATGASGAWVRKFTGPIKDSWFGVAADAVLAGGDYSTGTDDTTAMQAMAAFMRSESGHYVFDGGIRAVWPTAPASQSALMDVTGAEGLIVEYLNGASIHAIHPNSTTDSASVMAHIWDITGCTGFTCRNPALTQDGAKVPSFTDGVVHFSASYRTAGVTRRTRITGVKQTGGLGGLIVSTAPSTSEADISRDFVFEGEFKWVYYPLNLQGNGDDVRGNIKSTQCGRSFFPYNVSGCRVYVDSDCDGGHDDVLIKNYTNPAYRDVTSDIEVHYRCRNGAFANPGNMVQFAFQQYDATSRSGKMLDVKVHIDANIGNFSGGVATFWKFTAAGTADSTARSYQVRGVEISGTVLAGALTQNPLQFFNDVDWTGESILEGGWRDLLLTASGSVSAVLDGRGVNGVASGFLIENVYTFCAPNFTNTNGKISVTNSNIGGSYYDGDYSGWKVSHHPKGRLTMTYQGMSLASGATVTLPITDAKGLNPTAVITSAGGVAVSTATGPLTANSFNVLHNAGSATNFNLAVEMNY